MIDSKALRFCSDRLVSLLSTLEEPNIHEYRALRVVCDFASLTATYSDGFRIVFEPYDEEGSLGLQTFNPVLQLACLDASVAVRPVFRRFNSVVITSGTLSPLDMYPKMLDFLPVISQSFKMTLTRNCICPLIVSRGNDQTTLSSKYDQRDNPAVKRNFGQLVIELAATVPDGMIVFFTSYKVLSFATFISLSPLPC